MFKKYLIFNFGLKKKRKKIMPKLCQKVVPCLYDLSLLYLFNYCVMAGTTGRQENGLKLRFKVWMAFHLKSKRSPKGVTSWATSSNLTSFWDPPFTFWMILSTWPKCPHPLAFSIFIYLFIKFHLKIMPFAKHISQMVWPMTNP